MRDQISILNVRVGMVAALLSLSVPVLTACSESRAPQASAASNEDVGAPMSTANNATVEQDISTKALRRHAEALAPCAALGGDATPEHCAAVTRAKDESLKANAALHYYPTMIQDKTYAAYTDLTLIQNHPEIADRDPTAKYGEGVKNFGTNMAMYNEVELVGKPDGYFKVTPHVAADCQSFSGITGCIRPRGVIGPHYTQRWEWDVTPLQPCGDEKNPCWLELQVHGVAVEDTKATIVSDDPQPPNTVKVRADTNEVVKKAETWADYAISLLKALAGVLGAVGAVWIAWKTFGKPKPKDEAPPPDKKP